MKVGHENGQLDGNLDCECYDRIFAADIARVCGGCALLRKESTSDKTMCLRLWAHEMLRVFYDRLVNVEDLKRSFKQIIIQRGNGRCVCHVW